MHAAPAPGQRIAFFGGSFDPPHTGHLAIARAARAALHLDQVLFAPVGSQPLKPGGASARFEDRLAMTRLCIAGESGFTVSLEDAPGTEERQRPNYTIDTLRRLRTRLPASATLFCLMGADSFLGLRQWHRGAEIPFVVPLIVASRPGQSLEDLASGLPPGLTLAPFSTTPESIDPAIVRVYQVRNPHGDTAPLYLLPNLHEDISASLIRESLEGSPSTVQRFLTPSVAAYIRQHGLYRETFTCGPQVEPIG